MSGFLGTLVSFLVKTKERAVILPWPCEQQKLVNILVIANDVPPFQAQVPLNRPSVMQHHWALKYVS